MLKQLTGYQYYYIETMHRVSHVQAPTLKTNVSNIRFQCLVTFPHDHQLQHLTAEIRGTQKDLHIVLPFFFHFFEGFW